MLILFFFRQDAGPIGVGTGAPDTDLRHQMQHAREYLLLCDI